MPGIIGHVQGSARPDFQASAFALTQRASTTRASAWSSQIDCTFRVQFSSEEHAVQFFNTGSQIRIALAHPSTATSQDSDWNGGLNGVYLAFAQRGTMKLGGATGSAVTSRGYYQMTTSYLTIYDGTDIGAGAYSANYYGVQAAMNSIPGSNGGNGLDLRINVYLVDDHANGFFDSVSSGTVATLYTNQHSDVAAPTCSVLSAF